MATEVEQNSAVEDERITIRISHDLKEKCEKCADQDHRSLSNWIKKVLAEATEREGKE